MSEMRITVRIMELRGGGFVIAEELANGTEIEWDATQAVSSIDEACGAVQKRLRDWNSDCKQLRVRQIEDESGGQIIAPKRWWRRIE